MRDGAISSAWLKFLTCRFSTFLSRLGEEKVALYDRKALWTPRSIANRVKLR